MKMPRFRRAGDLYGPALVAGVCIATVAISWLANEILMPLLANWMANGF